MQKVGTQKVKWTTIHLSWPLGNLGGWQIKLVYSIIVSYFGGYLLALTLLEG